MSVIDPVIRTSVGAMPPSIPRWSRADTLLTAAWMVVAMLVRAPLVARIERILDHDQSIVGLMALDIAAGRRFPIFFDGQRYMGAVEAYMAAAFVALFGHSPVTVALSPLFFFGLFVAGQYMLWRTSSDRLTGHLAALISVLGAPMLVLWSAVPRGGYIELMAWALPVLAIYRVVTQPARVRLTAWQQAAWGFLLASGYFLNPLSLIVYVTLAVDWVLGRHGTDLREEHGRAVRWVDSRWALLIWAGLAFSIVMALATCCHVEFQAGRRSPFVFLLGSLGESEARLLGSLGVAAILAAAAWWSGAVRRVWRVLPSHPWFALGALGALVPFLAYNLCVLCGLLPFVQSLPIWIRAPWSIGVNLRDGALALGPLVGCEPNGAATVLVEQGVELPPVVWSHITRVLQWLSPIIVATVVALLGWLVWIDRAAWRRFWGLRGEGPTRATILALLGLGVATTLYLLQATSPNSSSIRYLVPAWIMLPGLLASGLRHLSPPRRWTAAVVLLVPWTLAQVNLWRELEGPSPFRPLAIALEQRDVRGIVADTPIALIVANLTHGEVGALEYDPKWPRLGNRYADRFPDGRPVICVVDTQLEWNGGDHPSGMPLRSLCPDLVKLAESHPGRVRLVFRIAQFETWEVDLPLAEFLPRAEERLSRAARSASLAGGATKNP